MKIFLNAIFTLLFAVPVLAQDKAEDFGSKIRFKVEKYKLDNGMTVLLHEDHSAPLISYHTWFRVGSKNEEPGYTGIAHLFEHMMFKGAKRYGPGQFDEILQSNGARNNAFTSFDYTGYYENLPSSKLELVMDIESDRMENLQINPENLKSERDVVKEERRFRVDNNPTGILREVVFSTAFKVHPYRWPVIGWMKDLDNINLEKSQEFYRTFYAPNNAVLVIAGDFDPKKAKSLVERYYGKIKSQPIPERTLPPEPTQTGMREQVVVRDVQGVTFSVSYHSVAAGNEDSYAMDLLANIIGNGTSSRLHRRLVYQGQWASSAYAYNYTPHHPGLFQVVVALKPGVDYVDAQKAVFGEMWRTRNQLVKDHELEKAKNQVMKDYVESLKTIHGKAHALALNEIYFNDYEQLFKDLDRYNQVTAEHLKAVAEKYLKPEQSSVVILKPRGN